MIASVGRLLPIAAIVFGSICSACAEPGSSCDDPNNQQSGELNDCTEWG